MSCHLSKPNTVSREWLPTLELTQWPVLWTICPSLRRCMARVTFKFFTSSCLHVRTPLPLSPAYLLYYCLPPSLNLRILLLLLILLVFSSPSLVIGLSLAFPSSPPPVHYVIPANPHLPLGRAPIGRGWGFEDGCDCNMWHLSVKW